MSQSITLRQAHKLVDKINGKIRSINLKPVATINVWEVEDSSATLGVLTDMFNVNLERVQKLTNIRNEIRVAIMNHNHTSGINTHIAERKKVLDNLALISSLVLSDDSTSHLMSPLALSKKIDSLRQDTHSAASYRNDVVTVSLLNSVCQAELAYKIDGLKRDVEQLDDKLLHLNTTTKVYIEDSFVVTLQNERLI